MDRRAKHGVAGRIIKHPIIFTQLGDEGLDDRHRPRVNKTILPINTEKESTSHLENKVIMIPIS